MKGMKARKILSLFVVLCMVFTYSGVTAFADDELGGDPSSAASDVGDSTSTGGDDTTATGGGDTTTTGGGDITNTSEDITNTSDITNTVEDDDNATTDEDPTDPTICDEGEEGCALTVVHLHLAKVEIHCKHALTIQENGDLQTGGDKVPGPGIDGSHSNMVATYQEVNGKPVWTIVDGPDGLPVCEVCFNNVWISLSNKDEIKNILQANESVQFGYGYGYGNPSQGNLVIFKKVVGDNFVSDTFKFVVSQSGKEITSAAITVDKAGEEFSVTIQNLPAGKYTLEEVDVDTDVYQVSYDFEGEVAILAKVTTVVRVTNQLIPPPPEPELGALQIVKRVTGDGFTTDTFKFKITGEDFTTEAAITVDEVDKEFTVITINNLVPGEYTVEEIVDAGKYTVTYSVVGYVVEDDAVAVTVAVVKNETATVKVTNKLIPPPPGPKPGKLIINKEVLHNGARVSGNNVFFFKLYKDNEPYFVNGQQNVFKLTPENGFDKIEITLPAGVYTVEEVMDGDGTPIGEGFAYTVTYAIGEGARTAGLISSDIAIEEDGIGTVTFYNATTGGGGGGGGGRTTTTTTPTTNIREPEVPLIRPEEVQLAPEMIILDEEVPLADIPQTGLDNDVAFNLLMLGFSLSALLAIFARKKDVTNK